jgi:23S rRNA (adenine2503-C2)-methyltransferase
VLLIKDLAEIIERSPARAKITKSLQRNLVPLQLLGKSVEELRALAASWGEPAYRGDQIYHALYAEQLFDVARMTTLSAKLRDRLASETEIRMPRIAKRYHSADGSVRYLLALEGDASLGIAPVQVEAVFMPDAKEDARRQTICISTQAGCAVDCKFCLTAVLGLNRNLSAGEIVGQVLVTLDDQREHLLLQTNVVLMGQGEPLLNYDAVMSAVRILLDQRGVCLAPKHVTLSTSGIVPGIERLGQEKVRPKLAISLNASNDAQRDAIMPINRKYPLAVLLDACRNYPLGPRDFITFEYVLLGGFNDAPEDARRVAKLLANIPSKVNLIPWNPGELPYKRPTQESIDAFKQILMDKGVFAFVRISRGQDIMAACGQLALIESKEIRAAV